MPCFGLIVFFLVLFSSIAAVADNNEPLPVDQAFAFKTEATDAEHVRLNWQIADGYYLYRSKFKITADTVEIQQNAIDYPDGEVKQDDYFGESIVYRNDLTLDIALPQSPPERRLALTVQYQGCADIGLCYPPQKKVVTVALPASSANNEPKDAGGLLKSLGEFKSNLFDDELLPPDQAFAFTAFAKDADTIEAAWQVADGYYLYREKIELSVAGGADVRLGEIIVPHGTPKHDEAFGQVEILRGALNVDVPVMRTDTAERSVTLTAKFQGCADRGVCYPPMTKSLELMLPGAVGLSSPDVTPISAKPVSEQDRIVGLLRHDTLWLTLLSFFGFGLLLAFTPCVFPMIPILSGIIVGSGKNITTFRAFSLSFSYVLASALTYTVFGILAAEFGSNLQATFQQPWVISLFSAVFVLLALSMFGFYTLELPKALQTKMHESSERHRDGSLWGAAAMGSFSSLIVGPCVAAPLAGALLYIGQTGDRWLGGSALFAMGLGMGTPLLLLGASAGKLLPKAGTWLNATKAVFGVVMLAVAVWMLERILPAPVTMFLWALLLIIPSVYLGAVDPLPEHAGGWRKLWKGTGVVMLIYGVLLLIGLGTGNHNPLKPLKNLGVASVATEEHALDFERIDSHAQLLSAVERSAAAGKIVMLDFYADWCISCKEMEAYTFSDPAVRSQLAQLALLKADVTANTAEHQSLLKKFGLVGPPAILFFGRDGLEKAGLRVIGYQDTEAFLQTLQHVRS